MQLRKASKIQRNFPCPCGSGVKYKKCCLKKEQEQIAKQFEDIRMLEKSECKCKSRCACEEIKE